MKNYRRGYNLKNYHSLFKIKKVIKLQSSQIKRDILHELEVAEPLALHHHANCVYWDE